MAKFLDYTGLQELVSKLKAYTDGKVSEIDLDLFIVVDALPTSDIKTNKVYLVPSDVEGEDNVFVEYIYVNGSWEQLGKATIDTDLSGYYTKEEVDNLIKEVEAGELQSLEDYEKKSDAEAMKSELEGEIAKKQDTLTAGTNISIADNVVSCTLDKVSELENDADYVKSGDFEAITVEEVDALFD